MSNELTVPQELKSQVLAVQKAANDFVVSSKEDLERGADLLHEVKRVEDIILERKESITRPLMQSLSNVRDLFKPLELSYSEAKKTIKAKLLAFQLEEEERINKDRERIERRVAKGTMRADTALSKIEGMDDITGKAQGAIGKISTRKIKKVRIVDEFSIPREYLVPDMVKITEAVLRGGHMIPGVEVYEEKILVGK